MSCASGLEYDAGLCYKACPSGASGVGPLCYASCPDSWSRVGVWCFESSTEADWAIAGIVVGSVALAVAAAFAAEAVGAVLIGGVETEAGTIATEESAAYFKSFLDLGPGEGDKYFDAGRWWVRFNPQNPLEVFPEDVVPEDVVPEVE